MDAVAAALPSKRNPLLALHRSESSFHEVLDRLPAAAYTCDAGRLITCYNRIAVDIWGREPRLYDPSDRFCGSFKLCTASGDPVTHDRQSRHMARLVDELLDLSRITSRKLELRCLRVDLREVINTAVETSRPLFDSGQRLLVSTPSSPLPISADPSRLAQALANVLNNASKYSDRGSHVWLNVDASGGEAVVAVADNGIGVAPDRLPWIFELFTQAVDAARADGGLGIGLALARHIVELHGGTLGVESDGVGKGGRFIMRIPIIA